MSDILEWSFPIEQDPNISPYEAELREQLDILYILDFDRDGMTDTETVVADDLNDYLSDNRGDIAKIAMSQIVEVTKDDKTGKAIIRAKPLAALIDTAVEYDFANRKANLTNNAIDFKMAVLKAASGDEIVQDMTTDFIEFIVTCYRWVSRM